MDRQRQRERDAAAGRSIASAASLRLARASSRTPITKAATTRTTAEQHERLADAEERCDELARRGVVDERVAVQRLIAIGGKPRQRVAREGERHDRDRDADADEKRQRSPPSPFVVVRGRERVPQHRCRVDDQPATFAEADAGREGLHRQAPACSPQRLTAEREPAKHVPMGKKRLSRPSRGTTHRAGVLAVSHPAHRSSLFASSSNHIPNSVNCVPEINRRATRTIVAVVISLSKKIREQATRIPRARPSVVIRAPRT